MQEKKDKRGTYRRPFSPERLKSRLLRMSRRLPAASQEMKDLIDLALIDEYGISDAKEFIRWLGGQRGTADDLPPSLASAVYSWLKPRLVRWDDRDAPGGYRFAISNRAVFEELDEVLNLIEAERSNE